MDWQKDQLYISVYLGKDGSEGQNEIAALHFTLFYKEEKAQQKWSTLYINQKAL